MFAVILAGSAALNAPSGRFVPLDGSGEGAIVSVWPTWDGAFQGALAAGLPLTADWAVVQVPPAVRPNAPYLGFMDFLSDG